MNIRYYWFNIVNVLVHSMNKYMNINISVILSVVASAVKIILLNSPENVTNNKSAYFKGLKKL